MTLKVWTIEVRVDFEAKEREEIMLKAVRDSAKHLLTTAQLISDKRKPDIAVHSDDMFFGRDIVSMFEAGELDGSGC